MWNNNTLGQTSAFGGQPTQVGGQFGGGLLGQQPAQPNGFGLAAPPQASSGLFGQSTAPTPTGGLFGQQPQQNTGSFGVSAGLFGQPAQPQASSGGLFGAPQQPPSSGFGIIQQSGFQNQPQSSGFGVQAQPGLFGQSGFGQQPTQAQSGFATQLGGGAPQGFSSQSAFGNLASGGFAGQQNQGFQPQNFEAQQTQGNKMIYSESQFYPQQISTINRQYQPKPILVEGNQMTFQSMKVLPDFDRASIQMLRLSDMLQSKGQPSVNYEFVASQEYNQQPQKYLFNELVKHLSQSQQTQGSTRTVIQTAANSQFNNTFGQSAGMGFQQQPPQVQSSFGGVTGGSNLNSAWNQPQQATPLGMGAGLFGQSQGLGGNLQGAQQSTGLFGGGPKLQSTPSLFGPSPAGGQLQASTGLFGQQPAMQQATAGGLFGQTAPQQPTQGGLFQGGLMQNNSPGAPNVKVNVGGLFGSQSAAPTGGLFGQQPQQQAAPGAGLFGQTPQAAQQPAGGGLFGQAAPQQPAPGGLFGNQAQQQPTGGLFSAQQQQPAGGSLFGQKPQAMGGLFGQQPAQPSLGLFNAQAQQPPGGGLFGQQPQTGLFSQQPQQQQMGLQQQQQQNAAAPSPYVDLYGSKDPLGIANSFLQKDHPMLNFEKEIEAFTKKIEADAIIKSNSAEVRSTYEPLSIDDFSMNLSQPQLKKYSSSTVYEEEANRIRQKEKAKYEFLMQQQQKARQEMMNVSKKPVELYRKDQIFLSKSTSSSLSSSQKPDLSRHKNLLLATSSVESAINNELLKITVVFNFENKQYSESFEIHNSRDTSDLLKRVLQWLKTDFDNFDGDTSDFEVKLNGEVLRGGVSFSDAKIVDETTLYVRIPSLQPEEEAIVPAKVELRVQKESELIPFNAKDLLPKKSKDGYKCEPSFDEIEKMTVQQLRNVPNFTVRNQFGSVQFMGDTDITAVDLADVITISQGVCEVYDDERHINTKPQVGQKLNKSAIITLSNMKPGLNQTGEEKERKLKTILEKNGDAEHLYYDRRNFEWQFKVKHFTKWGEFEDEQMEDSAAQKPDHRQERSAFEEHSDQNPIESSAVSQKQFDVEMKDGIPETLFKSVDEEMKQQNLKQRKIPQLTDSQFPKPIPVPSFLQSMRQAPVQRNQENSDSSSKILATIKMRKEVFSKLQPLETEKPENLSTIDYIKKDLGLKNPNLNKSSLARRGAIRPCFHPSGTGILKVEGNKIQMLKIPEVQPFSLEPLLSKNVQVNNASEQINQHFQSLSIQSSQVDQQMEPVNEVCKTQFTDEFFRKLLENPQTEASLFNGKNSINDFLFKTASHYTKEIQSQNGVESLYKQNRQNIKPIDLRREEVRAETRRKFISKLDQEFNVICMLNALFGNPNVHLVQLHPLYKGPKNIDRAEHLSTEIAEDSIIMVKKRRNAVTEVLRFVCGQNIPASNEPVRMQTEAQVYKTALEFLEVGDLKRCIKFLNSNKKTKVSLIVSQSVSNTAAMDVLRQHLQDSARAQNGVSDVLDFIAGQSKVQRSWEKSFLSALMYERCHTEPLAQIITHYEKKNEREESLLWKLLRVYARVKKSEDALCEMRGANLLANHDSRDFRIRWLTLLVLRKAFAENQIERQGRQDDQWVPHIPDSVLCDFSVRYIHQLLGQKNQHEEQTITEACLVAYLIPIAKYRKRVLFEILLRKPENMVCRVHLPEDYLNAAKALKYQSSKQSSKAIDTWIKVGNHSQAEFILREEYLPLRLPFNSNFTSILKFYRPPNVFSDQQLASSSQEVTVDNYIEAIRLKYPTAQVWEQTLCGLYKKTQKLVKVMTLDRPDYNLIQRELNEILAAVERQDGHSFVVEWIRIQMSELAMVLANKSAELLDDSHKSVEGLPRDLAQRYCSWQLQEGLVQLTRSAE